jgi:hypothetical protein
LYVLLSFACLQAKSQAEEWSKLAAQLSAFSIQLTNKLQKELVPQPFFQTAHGYNLNCNH